VRAAVQNIKDSLPMFAERKGKARPCSASGPDSTKPQSIPVFSTATPPAAPNVQLTEKAKQAVAAKREDEKQWLDIGRSASAAQIKALLFGLAESVQSSKDRASVWFDVAAELGDLAKMLADSGAIKAKSADPAPTADLTKQAA